MSFTKLNNRGFSHEILIVAFVAIFAIGGVAYIVASHADQCSTSVSGNIVSGGVSTPSSSANCGYSVSEPVTAPAYAVSGPSQVSRLQPSTAHTIATPTHATIAVTPKVAAIPAQSPTPVKAAAQPLNRQEASATPIGSCSIVGVPATAASRYVIHPQLVLTNHGTIPFAPTVVFQRTVQSGTATVYADTQSETVQTIAPGQTLIQLLPTYTMPKVASSNVRANFSLASASPHFSCSAASTMPRSSVWARLFRFF